MAPGLGQSQGQSQVRREVARWRKASQGVKGGGKVGKPARLQGRWAPAGNKVFQGDFAEKMMKGEFATGPPPSAEPAAATSHMAAPGLGVERSLCRVQNVVARAAK